MHKSRHLINNSILFNK